VPGAKGSVLRIYNSGDVALVSPAGAVRWDREPHSFWADWPLKISPLPGSPGVTWTNPIIAFGPDPYDPTNIGAGTPYAAGYVTGRRGPVVAVADTVTLGYPDEKVTPLPRGDQELNVSFVTLLDATTGTTLWSHEYPGYIMQLAFAGGRLLAAEANGPQPADPTGGSWGFGFGGGAGAASSLDAWAFAGRASGRLRGSRAWSRSLPSPWALWLATGPAGPGQIAVAWSDSPLGVPGEPGGQVALLSVANGRARWTVATPGYPRSLSFDPGRREVVALEELDPTLHLGYVLAGLRLADGATAAQVARQGAVPFDDLQVGDITGPGKAEWALTETDYRPLAAFPGYLFPLITRVSVFDPGSGKPRWQATVGSFLTSSGRFRNAPVYTGTYGLLLARTAAGAELIVASRESEGIVSSPAYPLLADDAANAYSDLRALSGSDGRLRWDHAGADEVSAPYLAATSVAGQPAVASVNMEQDLQAFATGSGAPVTSGAMLAGDIYAAVAARAPGGRHDLIMGGSSGAVFALDGTRLHDHPRILWQARLDGPVHQIRLVRLARTGPPSLVVAATGGLAVLSLNGTVRYQVPFGRGQAVLSFAAGALRPGGPAAIVVPTNALTALNGQTGRRLWRYQPAGGAAVFSEAAIGARGTVVAEYAVPPARGSVGLPSGLTALGVRGATGTLAWHAPLTEPRGTYATPYLFNGVTASPDIRGAGGDGAAFTWALATSYTTNAPGQPASFDWSADEVDVRDAATGALRYRQRTPARANLTHYAYAVSPAFGLADCAAPELADIGPSRITMQPVPCGDIAVARAGAAGTAVVMAPVAAVTGQFGLLAVAPGSYPATGGRLAALPNPLSFDDTGVVTADLSGTGHDDAVGLSYDWAAQFVLDNGVLWERPQGGLSYAGSAPTGFWLGEDEGPSFPTGIEVTSLP
jgi:hypothetical protein